MDLDQITPLVLTYNEAPNIGRCLERLRWAREVLLVDSYSTDETLAIAGSFPNVRVVQRAFDDFASQLQFGLDDGGIRTPWVLALDADYMITGSFVDEVCKLAPDASTSAYRARFSYAVFGHVLRGGVYPPVSVLFRKDLCEYRNDGHAYRLFVRQGKAVDLRSKLVHDDRKSLSRWLQSQSRYMDQEVVKLTQAQPELLSRLDRLRLKLFVAPPAVVFYSLFVRGGILDGWPGWFYALSRLIAESLLSMKLLEQRFVKRPGLLGDEPREVQQSPGERR